MESANKSAVGEREQEIVVRAVSAMVGDVVDGGGGCLRRKQPEFCEGL